MEPPRLTAVDTSAKSWDELFNEAAGKTLFGKDIFADPDTGMEVRMVRYPAGFINPLHIHHCAHGMYVLEGTLVTREGSFGEGHFV